ncbi:MAG: DEAD/DEAH box helicase, partial [Bacteroidales bacterium]|nr:DEAD/DEAH box helicase [Bacteroidales bacterium]
KVFLRDFENEIGYSDSADAKLNKLATTKHIMFAFNCLKTDKALFDRLDKIFPFIEIYCDPLNDYKISWYYPEKMPLDEKLLIVRYFKNSSFIEDSDDETFLQFIEEAAAYELICIRPEVTEKVERRYEQLMLEELKATHKPDFSLIHTTLFPYQIEGVNFSLFRKAAIIADEMGLGKTVQAIAVAVLKKQIFGFRKTLIVCPAILKTQWEKEILHFCGEKAIIPSGLPEERELQYGDSRNFFCIINYETVVRDSLLINQAGFDFLILDEAQKIKNYETKTSLSIKQLKTKHILVLTGTPIENRLIDIFSIVSAIDPYFFGPLWEFSYQYCLFDTENPNKISGYYNLNKLNQRLSEVLIRREKSTVASQLPDVRYIDIPVNLSPLQDNYHASYLKGVVGIIRKKFLTPYDMQRMTILLNNARMVCDSTFLVEEETNESPKLDELQEILVEKLDISNTSRKIIIFSEWTKVHKLIGRMLRKNNIGFVELNGKIPVKLRDELIKKFEINPECKVFLSTEISGSGLNLQIADILINFELPWNPAKMNQRIGRIDRLGQKSNKLIIYNFISRNSIEQQIAAGLLVKQNLFDGVLSGENSINYVDFSTKGRSQFIQQIEAFVNRQEKILAEDFNEQTRMFHPNAVGKDTNTSTDITLLELEEEHNRENMEQQEQKNLLLQKNAGNEKSFAENQTQELKRVMNSGMEFLAGLFRISTGKDLEMENRKIEIDSQTGEVMMRFKIRSDSLKSNAGFDEISLHHPPE